ncbi:MAG: hypothetical protein ABH986_01425 [archaeon]
MDCRFCSVCADYAGWKYLCNHESEAPKYCKTYHKIEGYPKIR